MRSGEFSRAGDRQTNYHVSRRADEICLVSAAGGHLAQILRVRDGLENVPHYLVTAASPQTEGYHFGCETFLVSRILRNPVMFFVNFLQSLRIFLRERPVTVVSTGSGEAVATFVIASCLGRRTIFIESFARVRTPSLTGRILRHFADVVFVQWEELLHAYPEALYVGPLFEHRLPEPLSTPIRILFTVGTQAREFDRLIRAADTLLSTNPQGIEAVAQIGTSRYEPIHLNWFRFLPPDKFKEQLEWADLVVTHSGAGLIGQALEMRKRVVVVPRDPDRAETLWSHDADLALELSRRGVVRMVTVEQLHEVVGSVRQWVPAHLTQAWSREDVIRAISP